MLSSEAREGRRRGRTADEEERDGREGERDEADEGARPGEAEALVHAARRGGASARACEGKTLSHEERETHVLPKKGNTEPRMPRMSDCAA